jgi:hypothetical protein
VIAISLLFSSIAIRHVILFMSLFPDLDSAVLTCLVRYVFYVRNLVIRSRLLGLIITILSCLIVRLTRDIALELGEEEEVVLLYSKLKGKETWDSSTRACAVILA